MFDVDTAPEATAASHTKTRSSGILVETKDDKVDALHAVCERPGGGFDYYRYDRGNVTWSHALASAGTKGNVRSPVVFTGMNYCLDGLYVEIAENREGRAPERAAGQLFHTYSITYHQTPRYPWAAARWQLPDAAEVCGPPSVCRWNLGSQGLEVIAPLASGGLRHWYRNDAGTWYTTGKHYTNSFSGCAMVMGGGKWLYLIAVETNGTLWAINRDGSQKWHAKDLGRAFTGQPALVESGRTGGILYDLVVPNETGPLIHYTATNWFNPTEAARFGVPGRVYRDVGLIYTHAGQLEVVARPANGPLEHYVNRFDGKGWVGGMPFPEPNRIGSWQVQFDLKSIGIHTAVLHTGQVVTYGMADDSDHHARGAMIDVKADKVDLLPTPMPHVFCSGQSQLPNGDLLIAGGHTGSEHELHKLERTNGTWKWQKLPNLHHGRWYPTVTTLPDGKALILSGSYKAGGGAMNHSYEIFDPKKPDDRRTRVDLWAEIGEKFCDDRDHIDMYPFVFVLPNKRVFVHSRYTTRFFDYPKTGKGSWGNRIDANFKSPRTYCYQGTAVLLPLKPDATNNYSSAKVAIIGGAGGPNAHIDTPATDTVELMAPGETNPRWTYSSTKLNTPRVMPDAVLLPDGTVLIVGGSRAGRGDGCQSRQPVLDAEIYDPEKDTFTPVAPMRTPRLYHATAVLLPDARVLVTGKCKVYNAAPYDYPEHRGEVYTPAYLLTGNPRPVVTAAPAEITAGGSKFDITVGGVATTDIERVVLIRLSSATHSFNMDQRVVFLPFTATPDKLTATAPNSNWVVPPGYYMLFAVSKAKVPSEAKFVKVGVFSS